MYIRTPWALAWVDDNDETFRFEPKPSSPRPPSQTILARRPFDGRLGRYIGIRRVAPPRDGGRELILVAVANKSETERGPWWVKAENALTEHEAARWAREGF